jgi:hypothetical protein
MSKTEIMEKYRAEFLLWYADYELEELEKIHALDTGDSSGALAVANAVADCLSELDKEIKASRLDAETKEQS